VPYRAVFLSLFRSLTIINVLLIRFLNNYPDFYIWSFEMSGNAKFKRRDLLKLFTALGVGGVPIVGLAAGEKQPGIGAMMPGKGWLSYSGEKQEGDGTPLQFIPKTAPDENPLQDELTKYPKCPYCGMDRTKWNHSRHLVQYDDNLVDGTCSIHCLAVSLTLNLDRGPKAIYAADFGSDAEIKPLVKVDEATYLIGAKLKGTMTKKSKMAFSSKEAAAKAQAEKGGEVGDFDSALRNAYLGMAEDTMAIRKRRKEKRMRMMRKKQQQAAS
jgi:nitrous oxide reductase accessory protein NosL